MFTQSEIKDLTTYYESFASYDERAKLDKIIQSKGDITEFGIKYIRNCLWRLKCRLEAEHMTVQSRLKR